MISGVSKSALCRRQHLWDWSLICMFKIDCYGIFKVVYEKGEIIIKKETKVIIFTSIFVFVVVFLFGTLTPNKSRIVSVIIAGLSGGMGPLIGYKIFKD